MDAHFVHLGLPPYATFEEARTKYYILAEPLHPDNKPQTYTAASRTRLNRLDAAWFAIQEYFHNLNNTPEAERINEFYHSDAELLVKAKENQEWRREQPRGALQVLLKDGRMLKEYPGLYEEYERVRTRNLGYVFDGEAVVTRKDGIDIIAGGPMFKNTTFTKSVNFAPKQARVPSFGNPLRFPKPAPHGTATPTATFTGATIFDDFVEFDVPAVFEGPVMFKKHAVFKRAVTFHVKPALSKEGFTHTPTVKNLWAEAA